MADVRIWYWPFLCRLLMGFGFISVSLAADGDIKLVGSERSIEGKLIIEREGVWRTVCFDGWTHEDASTACRQLGYSKGSMITRANDGNFAAPAATPVLQAPGCNTSHDRLANCPNFQFQENLSCSTEVDISCYVDDFKGCYMNTPPSWIDLEVLGSASARSIETCLKSCRTLSPNSRFAALAGPRCICGTDEGNLGSALSVSECAVPCTGDVMEACGSNAVGDEGNFAIWPVTVGASQGSTTAASGCLYSPGFPARYETNGAATTHEFSVTVSTPRYLSLTTKMFDIYSADRVQIRGMPIGSATATFNLTAAETAVIPFTFTVSRFSLLFVTSAESPSMSNYGFVICYESLEQLPTSPPTVPSTNPSTMLSTNQETNPPTAPPTVPPTTPPTVPSTASPSVASRTPTAASASSMDPQTVPTTPGPDGSTSSEQPVVSSSLRPPVTTDGQDTGITCPADLGEPVESRPGRETMTDILLINAGNPFNCTGFVTSVRYYSIDNQPLEVSIWRPSHDPDTDEWPYTFASGTTLGGAPPGTANESLDRDDWLPFGPGDVMGVRFQISPLVFSDAVPADGAATPWMKWTLENGSHPGSIGEKRNAVNATALNRTYSISVTLTDKARCLIPIVPDVAPADVIVLYVYEGDTYTLDCRAGYRPGGSDPVYTCQANGTFDRVLECEDGGIPPGQIFAVLIICVVVLVLICLTVFVLTCMLTCCRRNSAEKAASAGASTKVMDEPDAGMGDGNSMDDNQFLIDIDSENGELDGVVNPAEVPEEATSSEPIASSELSLGPIQSTDPPPDAHGTENGIPNPEADVEGTSVMENPVHNADDVFE
ncbi:mucin-5B-like [Acanthaster planci]|uniref:Mucin-5B-like n=1 Tax=Acanthaster planci TaxID=133434 RepID=A0A8B7Z9C9_ACAPL|nr:mucin-5B-like [Acanthaster planci]